MTIEASRDSELSDELAVRMLYQPVVDLDTGVPVGFEALARGPVGSAVEAPDRLFEQARRAGSVVELDWLCREAAVKGFRQAGMRYPLSLFVNAEPETLNRTDDAPRWARFADLRCYAELTERDLTAAPAELLRAAELVRSQDWGIALDDIGAVPESLALMPLLAPDVLKLDVGLLSEQPDLETARIVHAVLTQAAETGAAVVAEGIETPKQLETARGYGVAYGQGFLLGRPAPLPAAAVTPSRSVPLLARPLDRVSTPAPFAVVAGRLTTRRLDVTTVWELVRQLLDEAAELQPAPVLLASAPAGARIPEALRGRVELLADRLPLAVCLGPDLGPTVRGGTLPPDDPAASDLSVAVVSPHFAAVLVARPPVGTATGEASDCLDTALAFSRPVVVQAAAALLDRVPALSDASYPTHSSVGV